MKTKKSTGTNAKSRIIFLAAALTYNLLLGLYMKDILVLSPMLLTFYLLSVLPTFFLLGNVRSKSMRAVIFAMLFLVLLADIVYGSECRRMLLLPTTLSLLFEVMCISVFSSNPLFAAFCRSQNIPCYVVDGIAYEDSTVRHTWNRVYFNGCWRNTDITSDITSTANDNGIYGFRELQSVYEPDDVYCIMKIY